MFQDLSPDSFLFYNATRQTSITRPGSMLREIFSKRQIFVVSLFPKPTGVGLT
ncbi:hypothetical protein PM082_024154 [Marasmius tenuissimus]|nr:hypothetical protein PM082_024154 [Marasmius tenuissimus]